MNIKKLGDLEEIFNRIESLEHESNYRMERIKSLELDIRNIQLGSNPKNIEDDVKQLQADVLDLQEDVEMVQIESHHNSDLISTNSQTIVANQEANEAKFDLVIGDIDSITSNLSLTSIDLQVSHFS